jgi:molybdopterin molybdotransferase
MQRAADWLTVEDALARVLDSVAPLPPEDVPLLDALGGVLASAIVSPIDHPPWDNSAMDGFAVRSSDVMGATPDRPRVLRVVESVPAGGFPTREVGAGEAIRIMTGAPIPAGADGVVRVEHTRDAGAGSVEIVNDMDAGRNLRPKGEDVQAGAAVMGAGRRLRAADIGLLATMGQATVPLHRRPRVAILATGDELVDLDAFGEVIAGRRIVNSNSYALAAAVRATGGEAILLGIARDERSSIAAHLARSLDADVLVTTAGASVGDHDVVKDALIDAGFVLDFWRVQMRPGSPFSYGWLPRTSRAPLPVFGLPGNPVSALVTFEVFVRPAMRRLAGRSDVFSRTARVRAGRHIQSKRGLTHFLRARLERSDDGMPLAVLTGPQGSGLVSSMANADALLVVPLDVDRVDAGEMVNAILLEPSDAAQTEPGYLD